METGKQTRQTLLQKLQTAEDPERSWHDFVKYYEGYIYVVIRGLGVDIKDSEDLLQEVLVKVWKALPNYSYDVEKCRFRTWLCVVIRNTVFNFLDLRANKNKQNNVSYHEIKENLNLVSEAEIDSLAEKEWKSYISNMAWDNLKNDFSEINRKVFEASLDSDDNLAIAEKFNIAESSVRVYKMRVRKAVHKEIIRLNRELGG
ncbi:MAG: sigma-70 family RNA polymerase sigma factor [Lentisphaeraceae bacterium]|nr:sigma-70 family RNA polymerase sigma factor [Lentisphaeraceae bacterium]